jgi:hypothetical protein
VIDSEMPLAVDGVPYVGLGCTNSTVAAEASRAGQQTGRQSNGI